MTAVAETAATNSAATADGDEGSSPKELIYESVRDIVKEKTGKSIGKIGGREIFDHVVEQVFAEACRSGTIRFNGGFGSFHVRNYQAGERLLPNGQKTTFGERQKLRYEEGVVVKALVENKGNLEKALKVRGSRKSDDDTTESKVAAKAADKAAKAKAKPAAKVEAAAKTPKAVPAPKADAGDLDLD